RRDGIERADEQAQRDAPRLRQDRQRGDGGQQRLERDVELREPLELGLERAGDGGLLAEVVDVERADRMVDDCVRGGCVDLVEVRVDGHDSSPFSAGARSREPPRCYATATTASEDDGGAG